MEFRHQRFSRAASTYNLHSQVQKRMAEKLISLLPPKAEPGQILELGAGTGHLTGELLRKLPGMDMDITDVAESMITANREEFAARENQGFLRWYTLDAGGEGEAISHVPEQFDLIAANALVQWFPDLSKHFYWVARRLQKRGYYLVSGLLPDNFPEMQSILRSAPFGYENWPGQDLAAIEGAARSAGLVVQVFASEAWEETYASPEDFLRLIQGLGAALRPAEHRVMTRSRLKELYRRYAEDFSVSDETGRGRGVKATWKPWFALLSKPD